MRERSAKATPRTAGWEDAHVAVRIAAIVLAAGAGSRLGGGKMLVRVRDRPMLQHVLDQIAEAGVGEAVVVLGQDADAVEDEIAWRSETRVRNLHPDRGLASSLQEGMAVVDPAVDAVLILLGDQPFVLPGAIRALVDAPPDPKRPIAVPVYGDDRGRNPVLVRRDAFGLVTEATGDRGLGPILAAHPELVEEVQIGGDNPDIDTPEDLLRVVESDWAARVLANREQVDRIREVPDGADFYAPVRSLFRADPTRTDDPVLRALVEHIRSGETWLDVGAGAGRFALPIARALDPSGGSVIAVDASASMLEALLETADDHGIENVQAIHARWPTSDPATVASDVALIAHVGYDVEAIGDFIDALEVATRRLCVAVLMDSAPAAAADPFWPPVHGEARVPLPALPEFTELLRARGRDPDVIRVTIEPRRFESRDALAGFARRQLWIDPSGPKEPRFQEALERLTVQEAEGWTIRDRTAVNVGLVTWRPLTE